MPYIDKKARAHLEAYPAHAKTAGELNYLLTSAVVTYVNVNGLSYQTINDIVGALEGAKMEFYRRVAVPYERGKNIANGDVYPIPPVKG